jgi:hypothetical protein
MNRRDLLINLAGATLAPLALVCEAGRTEGQGIGAPYHPGHNCPWCGRRNFVVSRFLPSGLHTHACPRSGREWCH